MKIQKTPNNQNNLEKEHSWKNCMLGLKTILKSYSNQYSVALAQKQT